MSTTFILPEDYQDSNTNQELPNEFLNERNKVNDIGFKEGPYQMCSSILPVPTSSSGSSIERNIFANVAFHYGSSLMDSGKQIFHQEFDKYLTILKLKYYFLIDISYVKKKLLLLMFPFSNSDWTLKFVNGARVVPLLDLNAPDLYIPLMGFLTYILLGGIFHGVNGGFTPDILGTLASQGLALTSVELLLQLLTIYFINSINISYLELLSYSGYKFVSVDACVLVRILFNSTAYLVSVVYYGFAASYFIIKSFKSRLMYEFDDFQNDLLQNNSFINIEYKRKIYCIIITALSHSLQVWWLSSFTDIIEQ